MVDIRPTVIVYDFDTNAFNKLQEAFITDIEKTEFINKGIVIDFSQDWMLNVLDLTGVDYELTTLEAEGITWPWANQKEPPRILKITVQPNSEVKVRVNVTGRTGHLVGAVIYQDNCTCTMYGAWHGSNAAAGLQKEVCTYLIPTDYKGVNIKITNDTTSTGYFYLLMLFITDVQHAENYGISIPIGKTFNGTSQTIYFNPYPWHFKSNDGLIAVSVHAYSQSTTNPLTINIKVLTVEGWVTVYSFNAGVSTNPIWYPKFIPATYFTQFLSHPLPSIAVEFTGYGFVKDVAVSWYPVYGHTYKFNGYYTNSASNASTTVTTYTLYDREGKIGKFKFGKISITVPATGGSATLYINGTTFASYGAGADVTIDIPSDMDIWQIKVDLAGDGTNPATASIEGIELLGPYLIHR